MSSEDERINVTKTFLPPIEEYEEYLHKIWENNQLTNQGPLLKELEKKISEYLTVKNLQFVANGTIALQLSLEALDIKGGEIITTPFSYVATTSAILWQRCKPVYVDIDPQTLCIDPNKIEAAITKNTKAIMPVHVFGNPCDIENIQKIAEKYNLRVIYDAAHAFGVSYKGKSLLDYGDVSVCSFHSTKLFHSIEGGAVISNDKKFNERLDLAKRFGHNRDDHYILGINAKASELQAAMGLSNLKYIDRIIKARGEIIDAYDKQLRSDIYRPKLRSGTNYNNAYYPIILKNEKMLIEKVKKLNDSNIFPRRYFYPSLNTLPYLTNKKNCPVSEDISKRVLCLPLYHDLGEDIVSKICEIINS